MIIYKYECVANLTGAGGGVLGARSNCAIHIKYNLKINKKYK